MKIAIIDQGVDKEHVRLEGCKISGDTIYQHANGFRVERNVFGDDSGHGTAIASIINRIVPGTELFSVKLASEDKVITEAILCEGIKWCLSAKNVRIVNISLGVRAVTHSTALYDACRELQKAGIFIVAAAHNFPQLECYPADFPFVFGVGCGLVKNKLEYNYIGEGRTNILAKGTSQRVAWKDGGYKITAGTSYAAAHFTGILGRLIREYPDADEHYLRSLVREGANREIEELTFIRKDSKLTITEQAQIDSEARESLGRELFTAQRLAKVKRLAIFPASEKELSTALGFRDQSPMQFSLCLDYPRAIPSIMQFKLKKEPVPVLRRDLTPGEYDSFDTLALGYFLEIPVDSNILFGSKLISNCIKLNKNFISLDIEGTNYVRKLIPKVNPQYSGDIFMPGIDQHVIDGIAHFHQLPPVTKPVVAVVGTGSKQGKFTAQLRLKEILSSAGYSVAHISTEPQGALFGASFIFPYGFKGNVEARLTTWGKLLSTAVKGVQHYNHPDIVITGIQGGILPRESYGRELRSGAILSSLHYLLGVKPDVVVCAINPMDDIELIRQTLQTLRNFCSIGALFCVMTPLTTSVEMHHDQSLIKREVLDKEEMSVIMEQYAGKLQMAVIDIMDRRNDGLVLKSIQQYFS